MMRLLVVLLVSACSLATNFDRGKSVEQTAALCSDSIDNDGDGLADCQDWKCAGQPACCTIPVIVLDDDFEHDVCSSQACGTGACPASAERWQSWGSPFPKVCDGAFVPGKQEQCYDVGLLSVASVPLRPGLVVAAGFAGQPEPQGRLVLGVTFQEQVIGAVDPCAPIEPVAAALSITMVSATGGYRFIGLFGGHEVGATAVLSDSSRHELVIRVIDDRRVQYELDGAAFVTSSSNQTVPVMEQAVRVALMGRGSTAHIEDVRVTVGARCEDPTAWKPATRFLDFAVEPVGWDSFAVYSPTVVADELYFGGCSEAFGACETVLAGYGRAKLDANDQFVRENSCPVISSPGLVCPGGLESPFTDIFNNVFDLDLARGSSGLVGVLSQQQGTKIATIVEQGTLQSADTSIDVGPAGSWDAAEVCCASIVIEDDGSRRIWYSGRAVPGGPSRIGLAEWTASGIAKNPTNPVLEEGPAGGYDDHGVSDPDVIWDADRKLYRMWYVADGPLGLTSIANAVSTDGIHWHAAPENPIITAEAIGLRRVGAPDVVSLDGELQMWIEGVSPSRAGAQIYKLVNTGVDPASP